MSIECRELTSDDKIALYANLDALLPHLTKQVHSLLDADHVVDFICEKNFNGSYIVAETYLVTYVVVPVWAHPTATVLQELGVIKLYPDGGGVLRDVVDFLKGEATAAGASGVCMGTTMQNDDVPLSNKLLALGLTPAGRDFFIPV